MALKDTYHQLLAFTCMLIYEHSYPTTQRHIETPYTEKNNMLERRKEGRKEERTDKEVRREDKRRETENDVGEVDV